MNRKLVNGLLLVALASGGCGVFTSCKDTNEGFYNEVLDKIGNQTQLTGDLLQQLQQLKASLDDYAKKNDLTEAEQRMVDKINTEIGKLENIYATKEALNDYVKNGDLTTTLADYLKADALSGELAKYLVDNNYVTEDKLSDFVTSGQLEDYVKKGDLDGYLKGDALDGYLKESELQDKLDFLQVAYKSEINDILDILNGANGEKGLVERLGDVETNLTQLQIDQAKTAGAVAAIKTLLDIDEETGESSVLNGINNSLSDLKEEIEKIDDKLTGKNGLIAQVAKLVDDVALNQASINDLNLALFEHKQQFEVLQNQFASYINAINNRFDNTITDIVLNQAWNPMFGTINLPVGITSTMAANYYGKIDSYPAGGILRFPLQDSGIDVLQGFAPLVEDVKGPIAGLLNQLNTKGGDVSLDPKDVYMNTVEIDGEEYGKLGQLYLTINPNTANIAGTKFDLVTSSNDTKIPIKVVVSETDEKLSFGVTRTAANGFYRADLYVKPADAPSITVEIEEGLKTAMKDAITKHTGHDFAQLGKLIVEQMKDFLPAYGVKATWWTDNTTFLPTAWDAQNATEHNFFGKYEIAAAAIRPLSYEFMQGQGANKDLLPTVGSIKDAFNRVFDEFNFTIDTGITGITPPTFALDLSGVELKFGEMQIEVVLAGKKLKYVDQDGNPQEMTITDDPKNNITLYYTPDGVTPKENNALEGLVEQMTEAVKGMLADKNPDGTWSESSIQGQIQKNLISQVDKMVQDINKQLEDVNGKINESVDKIVNDIKQNLLGKLGRVDNLVDKYNKIANKINDLLKDPNHYLQVTMFYNTGNGDLGELSSNFNIPTIFNQAGGDALVLYATSYTAELIAPSYKKYVAVSRAWKADGTELDFSDPVLNGPQEINAASQYLNEVRPGNQQRFYIAVDKLQPTVKYEIVYSSLDYRGYTSTRLFYITVAE